MDSRRPIRPRGRDEEPRLVSGEIIEPREIVVGGQRFRFVVHDSPSGRPIKHVGPA